MNAARLLRAGLVLASLLLGLGVLFAAAGKLAGDAHEPAGISPAILDAAPHRVRGRMVAEDATRAAPGIPCSERSHSANADVQPARAPEPGRAEDAASCALAGRITRHGAGVVARVRVELERDRWIELATDADGTFACSGVSAGRHLVTVEVAGLPSCARTVALRPHRVAQLDLDFDRGELVTGIVRGRNEDPVADARVSVDGGLGTTDSQGRFALTSPATGVAEIVVQAPGWAWFTCTSRRDARTPLEIELEPACSVEVRLPELLRKQEVVVHVAPGEGERSSMPWHLLSPLRCTGQDVVTLEGLPAGEIEVWVLGAGPVARAEHVQLSEHRRERVEPREIELASPRSEPWLASVYRTQPAAARPRSASR